MPHWDAAEACDFEQLDNAYTNLNLGFRYCGGSYVLRMVAPNPLAIDRTFEHWLLRGPAARLAPPLLGYVLPDGHMVTRRIAAPVLADRAVPVQRLARYLRGLHGALPRLGQRYDPLALGRRYLAQAQALGRIPDPLPMRLIDDFKWRPWTLAACHNDLNPWNVLAGEDEPARWYTLDWEYAGDNDPLFDLIAMARGLRWPLADEDALIDHYYNGLPASHAPPARHRQQTRRLFLLREYAWALLQSAARHAADTEPHAGIEAQIDDSLSALRALGA